VRPRLVNFPAELPARLERNPTNSRVIEHLSSTEALLGHKSEAVRLALHALGTAAGDA
jgi:hypothetical protein